MLAEAVVQGNPADCGGKTGHLVGRAIVLLRAAATVLPDPAHQRVNEAATPRGTSP